MNTPTIIEFSSSLSQCTYQMTEWTEEEGTIFEIALTELDSNSVSFYEDIASRLPGKTVTEVVWHYLDSQKRSNPKKSAPTGKKSRKSVVIPSPSVNGKQPINNSRPPHPVVVSSVSEDEESKSKRAYRRRGETSGCSQKGLDSFSTKDGSRQNSKMETKESELSEVNEIFPMQVRREECLLKPSVSGNKMGEPCMLTDVGYKKYGSLSIGVVPAHSSGMSGNVAPQKRGRPRKSTAGPIPPSMVQSVLMSETQSQLQSQNLGLSMNGAQSYNRLKQKSVVEPEGSVRPEIHAIQPVLGSFPSNSGVSSSNYLWHSPTHKPSSYQLNAVKQEPQDFSHFKNARHQLGLPFTIKNEPDSPSRTITPTSYRLGIVKSESQDSLSFQNFGPQEDTMNTESYLSGVPLSYHSPCTTTAFSHLSGVLNNEPQDCPQFQEFDSRGPLMSSQPSMLQLSVINEPQEPTHPQNAGPQMFTINEDSPVFPFCVKTEPQEPPQPQNLVPQMLTNKHSSMFQFAVQNEPQPILPSMTDQNSYHGDHWGLQETTFAQTNQALLPEILSGTDNYLPFSMQQQQSLNIEPYGQSQVNNFSSPFTDANMHQVTSPWMADQVSTGDPSQQVWNQDFMSHTALLASMHLNAPPQAQYDWFNLHSSSTSQHAPGATSSDLPSSNHGASGHGYPF